jgi:hypothetical protein
MKYLRTLAFLISFIPLFVLACGPSPQKVTKEITIKAEPAQVWALVSDFGGMQRWHANVLETTLVHKLDAESGKEMNYRTLKLKDGGSIVEKQRETQADEMKLGVILEQGDIAVSNYSDAITVKPGAVAGESIVTWVGRFNNKANLMQAPEGQDNAAAIAAVESWFGLGLEGLKKAAEAK